MAKKAIAIGGIVGVVLVMLGIFLLRSKEPAWIAVGVCLAIAGIITLLVVGEVATEEDI